MAVLCSPLTSVKVNFDDFEHKRNRCRIDFDGFEWLQKPHIIDHCVDIPSSAVSSVQIEGIVLYRLCFGSWKCFAKKRHHVLQLNWNVNVATLSKYIKLHGVVTIDSDRPKFPRTSPSYCQHRIMQKRVIWFHLLSACLAAHPAMKWSSSLHFGRSSIPFANKFQANRMQDASQAVFLLRQAFSTGFKAWSAI